MAVGFFRSFFLFSRQQAPFVLCYIVPVAIDIPFLRVRGELRAFGLAVWMGGSCAVVAPGILLVETRYIAVAIVFEASLHFYGGIIGFANEDLRFLQKAISIQLLGRH